LREIILSGKRPSFPKWRFKLEDEIGLDLQGKGTYQRYGREQIHPHLAEGELYAPLSKSVQAVRDPRYARISFKVEPVPDDGWLLRTTGVGSFARSEAARALWASGDPRPVTSSQLAEIAMHQRLVAVFADRVLDHLKPSMMLEDRCLCCGKGLTDPQSMLRWIGPECSQKHHIRSLAPDQFDLPGEAA
jgi:hypothetical protein